MKGTYRDSVAEQGELADAMVGQLADLEVRQLADLADSVFSELADLMVEEYLQFRLVMVPLSLLL